MPRIKPTKKVSYSSGSGIGNKGFDLSLFSGSGAAPAGWRPFDENALINKPIIASPTLHANSAAIIAKMVSWGNPRDEYIGAGASAITNTSDFNHPLYFGKDTDPLYTIQPTGDAYSGWSQWYGTQIRIPNEARGANGSDAHLSVVDFTNGYVWDFYHFMYTDTVHKAPSGGGNIVAKACTRMSLAGSGWAAANIGSEGVITDAAGLSGIAGAFRPEEAEAGVIDHALAMVVKSTDGTFVAPGVGTAGSSDPTNAPPSGVCIQLNMTNAEIDALGASAHNKMLYKALAKYGAFVRDTGSASWSLLSSSSASFFSQGVTPDPWHTFGANHGLYFYATGGFYLWEIQDPGGAPNWATKLRVLDPTATNR